MEFVKGSFVDRWSAARRVWEHVATDTIKTQCIIRLASTGKHYILSRTSRNQITMVEIPDTPYTTYHRRKWSVAWSIPPNHGSGAAKGTVTHYQCTLFGVLPDDDPVYVLCESVPTGHAGRTLFLRVYDDTYRGSLLHESFQVIEALPHYSALSLLYAYADAAQEGVRDV